MQKDKRLHHLSIADTPLKASCLSSNCFFAAFILLTECLIDAAGQIAYIAEIFSGAIAIESAYGYSEALGIDIGCR